MQPTINFKSDNTDDRQITTVVLAINICRYEYGTIAKIEQFSLSNAT